MSGMRSAFKLAAAFAFMTLLILAASRLGHDEAAPAAALEPGAAGLPGITPHAPEPHGSSPAVAPFSEPEREPRVEVAIGSGSGPRERVRGRVVAEADGKSLPHMRMRLEHENGSGEELESGADGRFESLARYPEGALEIFFVEGTAALENPHSARSRTFRSIGAGGRSHIEEDWRPGTEILVETAVGPTFRLRLAPELDRPAGEFLVRLCTPGERATGTVVLAGSGRFLELAERVGVLQSWSVVTELRGDIETGFWARFAPIDAHVARNGPPWSLSVERLDGMWVGATPVEALVDGELTVRLEALARTSVAIVDPEGRPEADVDVDLIRIGPSGEELARWTWRSQKDCRHDFGIVPTGHYLLSAGSLRHQRVERSFRLADLEEKQVELTLERLPLAGSILGTLASRAGTLRRGRNDQVQVELRRGGESTVLERANARWDLAGEQWECWFYFGRLPPDVYELRVVDLSESWPWEPASLRVSPPAEELTFERLDDGECDDLSFVVKGPGEAPPRDVQLALRVNGGPWRIVHASDAGALSLPRFPRQSALDWVVVAEGCAPARGDRANFAPAEGGLECSVQLAAGFGTRFVVREEAPGEHAPLAGARVLLDGVDFGETNALGVLDVTCAAPPKRVEVQHPSWLTSGGSLDPQSGALLMSFPECEVEMSPIR